MTTAMHNDVIEMLKAKGCKKNGFWKEMRKYIKTLGGEYECFSINRHRLIPDAFNINEDEKLIECWEVEDYNRFKKYSDYAQLWFDLDCESLFLKVYLVDRYGNLMQTYGEDYWTENYYALLKEDIATDGIEHGKQP